jgi:hypothetical protein
MPPAPALRAARPRRCTSRLLRSAGTSREENREPFASAAAIAAHSARSAEEGAPGGAISRTPRAGSDGGARTARARRSPERASA